ncbi:hypothetical protein RIF29_32622 [Crotalaria pallida]|uniref:Uncharacterized protein n=1 Tax=Crotalaria pallida TaxID=3830 RepID=A0AAN9EQJ1_CROPI
MYSVFYFEIHLLLNMSHLFRMILGNRCSKAEPLELKNMTMRRKCMADEACPKLAKCQEPLMKEIVAVLLDVCGIVFVLAMTLFG